MPAHRPPARLAAFDQLGDRRLLCFGQAANETEPHRVGDAVEKICRREKLGFHAGIKLGTRECVNSPGKIKKD